MIDLGRLLRPAALVRIALFSFALMALFAYQVHAQDTGIGNFLLVTLQMTAIMVVATVGLVFALLVASRGGLVAWQAGRQRAAGQTGTALESYNRALARNPNQAEALVARAELQSAGGNTAAALADLDRALTVTPHVINFPDPILYRAYMERGRLREGRGDLGGASTDWTQAGRAAPGSPDPYVLRGRAALERGDWLRGRSELATGVQILGQAISRTSDAGQRAALLNMRGLAYNLLGEHQRALNDLERALEIQPNAWVTHYNIGATYVNIGHLEPALAELRQAIALNPAARAAARTSRAYAPLRGNPDFVALLGAGSPA